MWLFRRKKKRKPNNEQNQISEKEKEINEINEQEKNSEEDKIKLSQSKISETGKSKEKISHPDNDGIKDNIEDIYEQDINIPTTILFNHPLGENKRDINENGENNISLNINPKNKEPSEKNVDSKIYNNINDLNKQNINSNNINNSEILNNSQNMFERGSEKQKESLNKTSEIQNEDEINKNSKAFTNGHNLLPIYTLGNSSNNNPKIIPNFDENQIYQTEQFTNHPNGPTISGEIINNININNSNKQNLENNLKHTMDDFVEDPNENILKDPISTYLNKKENIEENKTPNNKNYQHFNFNSEIFISCKFCQFVTPYIETVEYDSQEKDFKVSYKCPCINSDEKKEEAYFRELIYEFKPRDCCIKHDDNLSTLDYFCNDCQIQICEICKNENHQNHSIRNNC